MSYTPRRGYGVELELRMNECLMCGSQIEQARRGRPRIYCSDDCKIAARSEASTRDMVRVSEDALLLIFGEGYTVEGPGTRNDLGDEPLPDVLLKYLEEHDEWRAYVRPGIAVGRTGSPMPLIGSDEPAKRTERFSPGVSPARDGEAVFWDRIEGIRYAVRDSEHVPPTWERIA